MSSPYLKSGENIILTTDRVSSNAMQYEVLLTTRHLILVDTGDAQFLPQKIPLSTIVSVKGGKIASGEPVITLSFSDDDTTAGSGQMTFIFSQHPGEQRKRERDEWLKNLMGLIVSVRQETTSMSALPADAEPGIRPSIRRSVAHEKVTPYTTAIDTHPVPVEMTILPDESESLAFAKEEHDLPFNAYREGDTKSDDIAKTPECEDTLPVSGEESGSTDTIPLSDERSVAKEAPVEPETTILVQKTFALTLDEAIKSLIASNEKRELPDTVTSAIPQNEETGPAQREEPGSMGLPASPETGVLESPTVFRKDSDLPGTPTLKAGEITKPGDQPAGETAPKIPKPPLPTDGMGRGRLKMIAVVAIILFVLGIGVGLIYYPQYFVSPGKGSVSPPVLPLQQVHLLQTSVQQTLVQQTQPVPQTTLQQTQVQQNEVQQTPQPAQRVIPSDGVWVRVVYEGNYHGRVGNPGSLRGVKGSGDQIYKIYVSDGLVELQIYKDDNSGNPLTVEIYRNGELITHRVRSIPMSSIELLIDAKTGNPPQVTSKVTPETNQTGSKSSPIMYF